MPLPSDDTPDRIGRYLVLSELGRGAHGVVYTAYDPQLDRKVAIKLLPTDRARSPRAEAARQRLLREARALASIVHPNVIAVFDSGVFERRGGTDVFLVMELVEGEDLSHHLERLAREIPNPQKRWPRVLELFRTAGQGLAAVHRRGLVHRDFKPANVLVAEDGRVLVGDFGLVRSAHDDDESVPPSPSSEERESPYLTRSGELLGTPAYMSPEQHVGRPTGPASDQFSFALALWQALYGEPAFAGESPPLRALAVMQGELRPVPRAPRLPPRVVAALRRALALEPEARHPSMSALLEALEPRPASWIPVSLGVGAALLLLGVGLGYVGTSDPCEAGPELMSGVWDPPRRAALTSAWSSVDGAWVERATEAVRGRLDDYAESWVAAQRAACRDTRVLGIQSETRMDRRMACLQLRQSELEALVKELLSPTEALLERAPRSVEALSPIEDCARLEAKSAPGPEATRALVAQARARAQLAAGRWDAARESLATAAAASEALVREAATEILARQHFLQGRLARSEGELDEAEAALRKALRASLRLGERELAGDAARTLAELTGLDRGRLREGLAFVEVAGGLESTGSEEPPEVLQVRAALLAGLGEREEAVRTASVALARLAGAPLARGHARTVLGEVLVDARDYAAARPVLEAAVDDLAATLGREHPSLVRPLTLLSRARFGRGDVDAAETLILEALELASSVYGARHPERAKVLLRLGPVLAVTSRLEDSVKRYLEALDILREAYGERHTVVARAHVNLGASHHRLGELDEAEQHYRAALRIREALLGPGHPDLVIPLQNLGSLLIDRGRPSEAIPIFERTWRIRQRTFASPVASADVTFWLGRALWESRAEPERGLRLMGEALAVMEAEGAPAQGYISEYLKSRRLLRRARASE